MKKLILLSGTNRPGSNTRKVTEVVAGLYRELGNPARILDLAELPSAVFSPAAYAEKPAEFVERFSDPLLASDGLVIVTPEYNGSMPGVLKLFVDMLKFPESFEERPVCFIGLAAGMWGALRSVEQLQHIFAYRGAHLFPGRVFMPGIGGLLDENGRVADEAMLGRLRAQAAGFLDFVRRLRD